MDIRSEEKENEIIFYLNIDIYTTEVIMKAAYNFIEEYYVLLDYSEHNNIKVTLEGKYNCSKESLKKCKGEFCNELLRQSIRYMVSKETKNIREILMGKALYDTCIEYENSVEDEINNKETIVNDNLDIFTNWFDKNEA